MKLHYLEETESTNSYSKENIDNLEDRTIVYTSKQTAGRGRFNRTWVDLGSENIFMSIILKPSNKLLPVYSNLTQYTALKLAQTFETYGVTAKIKWPNDILVENKKISGILAETAMQNSTLKGIIIGIGINLNANEKDFAQIDKDVTSLNLEVNKPVNKSEFLNKLIENFFNNYDNFIKNGFMTIKQEYTQRVNFLGKTITITNFDDKITGIAEEITDNGSIVVNGKEFLTGDIL